MGFFDRLGRLVRANANAAVSSMEDPVKILDQSVADMQADLVKLRQAVATAIASQKRLRNQADQAEAQSKTWYERAELALKKGEEDLPKLPPAARPSRRPHLPGGPGSGSGRAGGDPQESLVALEGKIAEARTKKDMLKARAQAARPSSSFRVRWEALAATRPWLPLSAWKTRSKRWKPRARPLLSWPVPISRASSWRLKVATMWMTNWPICARNSLVALRQSPFLPVMLPRCRR